MQRNGDKGGGTAPANFSISEGYSALIWKAIVRQTPRSVLPDRVGKLLHGCVRECCGGFGCVVICLYAVIEGFCITEEAVGVLEE